MPFPPNGPTPQRRTADLLITAFNAMDIDAIMSLRHPACLRHLLPRSMHLRPQDNATYEKSLRALTTVFRNFHLDVHDVMEDVGASKVVLWLSARADTAAGEYVNEYMWVLEFGGGEEREGEGEGKGKVEGKMEGKGEGMDEEGGVKIVSVREFVDTVVQREFWPRLKDSMKVAAARGGDGGAGATAG